ncbi:MAG: helix-turn-helix domain protein [Mucilaginibacter sp.]|nr:helix-turn-helix domain protein [Mucilaginibacter sp.]
MGIGLFYCMAEDGKEDKVSYNQEELKKLGNRIKNLRVKAGFTNYEYFAYKHEIPRAQFGRYERGEDLRYTSLLKVIKALDITIKEFFSEGFD